MGLKPLVMVTNDDGHRSTGLLAAWQAIRDLRLADTLVVVPESPVGGAGKSITVYRQIKLSSFSYRGMKGYKIDGTPADCVLLGINKIAQRRPDLVVSGINLGANLGLDDLTSSGTMGACIQASMYGVRSICASYCVHDYSRTPSLRELAKARRVIGVVVGEILMNRVLGESEIMVVSVPEGAAIKQARETNLAVSPMPDMHREAGEGLYSFVPRTLDLYSAEREDDDVSTVMKGMISLTVVDTTLQSRTSAALKELVSRVNQDLGAP